MPFSDCIDSSLATRTASMHPGIDPASLWRNNGGVRSGDCNSPFHQRELDTSSEMVLELVQLANLRTSLLFHGMGTVV